MAFSRTRSSSRPALAAASVLLAATAAVSGTGSLTSSASAATPSLAVSPAQPLTNEVVLVRGALAPTGRPVALQKLVGGRWAGAGSARTGSGGAYAFKVRATTASTAYRVVASAVKVGRKKYAAATTRTVAVRGTSGTGSLSVGQYPIGNASGHTLPAVARFSPARPGKTVVVLDSAGRTVGTGVQGSDGVASVPVPTGAPGTSQEMHAMTFPGNGAANIATGPGTATTTTATQTFDDEFDGTTLDRSKWGVRTEDYYGGRTCSKPDASQVKVTGGNVVLSIARVPGATSTRSADGHVYKCPHGVWKNGVIGTSRATSPFAQAYGTFAARVALNSAKGMHGSFWLQGVGGSDSSEIDVVEHFGVGSTDGVTTKIHKSINGTVQTSTWHVLSALRGRSATLPNVYSVQWSPGLYIFSINGVETFRTSQKMASSPEEMVLSLLSSDWEIMNLKDPSSTMKVDWVRAWS